jgi:uroporphyrinogen decarboxylase
MTPRERWLAALAGSRADRTPCDYWGTDEVTRRLLRELDCRDERELWLRLGIDKLIHLAPTHRKAKETTWHTGGLFSIWGVETRAIEYGDGIGAYEEDLVNPLAGAQSVREIEQFPWPDPDDWDYAGMRAKCDQWPGYPILGGVCEAFYVYCRLRGMERSMEDLAGEPAIAEAMLENIFRVHTELIRRTLEAAADSIDLVYVAEDLGTQHGLLMSPAAFRRFLKPGMRRMIELVHSFGVKVMHHDDGAIRPLIPDLIEIGIDVLNPVQWRCRGMEREGLVRDFGRDLVFHGAVDNQRTLPFGSPEDVRREVAENIRIFSDAKGYVVAPCHNLQPNTPTANILALYEAIR